ncbi:PEP-CTERM sorting domain-containing protein [Pseudoduganella sp. LjRoot289]|uniref:PEP-CTERM sorting domain-containing protein n=1 Tax=Pseudoduganella sp. LjRoot289 TaxID=3342314 RepID=UPI003ED087B6
MNKLLKALLVATILISSVAQAVVVRGSGTTALIGGDLTDPENNGNPEADVGYNASFRSSVEQGFGGGEYAFNVFDNQVGGGNDKWCCDGATVWVEANFGAKRYNLTKFTAASGNDAPERDADIWQIQGSNDGINYTSIFSYNNNGVSAWGGNRLQVLEYSKAGGDFSSNAAYSIFRYQATSVVGEGGMHQLNELEFFGTQVPEPGTLALSALGLIALVAGRRKKRA